MTAQVEVYSDPVCPWCFIGKRRLEAARKLVRDDLHVTWRAFQLNPAMPADGMDRMAYLSAKFGGGGRARLIYDAIRREGLDVGIAFNFPAIQRTPNTLLAHRLIRFAAGRDPGHEENVIERLFAAYFLEGRDIGRTDTLAEIASEAGLDGGAAVEFLEGDAERDDVLAEDRKARETGVSGIPHFTVAGRYVLPGAQSPEVIARAIELARAAAVPSRSAAER